MLVIFVLQGFTDTSLTVGEAAAVLRNYERRTGDVLGHADLQEKALLTKLQLEDYNIKGQVLILPFISLSLLAME